ncbi:hypothetical protein SOASR014_19700 [Pectobacterium carotovorum subsp. carotovorum]|nr:hypothetical protein SOASR014_19700 [Pectobacterium carotovorum subsp. carotovorum]GLX44866.1 hypothetical protein Pcaca01_25340 [Pectobacterium carotovorum subsp. carotovorum]
MRGNTVDLHVATPQVIVVLLNIVGSELILTAITIIKLNKFINNFAYLGCLKNNHGGLLVGKISKINGYFRTR